MSLDIHNCLRGACLQCGECPSFISVSGRILCDYCGCPPARHERQDDERIERIPHNALRHVMRDATNIQSTKKQVTKRKLPVSRGPFKISRDGNKTRGKNLLKENKSKTTLNKIQGGRSNMVVKRHVVAKRRMPRRVDLLLDLPEVKVGWKDQARHGWNVQDKSHNLFINVEDGMTFHRLPVAQSTDAIRTMTSYEKGLHVFSLTWSTKQRGTHAVVGVATADAPIHSLGYVSLVGSDENSWSWDLGRSKAYHDGNNKSGTRYPAFLSPVQTFAVPETFLMILDMDEGTLAFAVDDQYLGVAHKGLRGKKLFPIVSTVWGHCEISIKYVGGLDSQPMPLMDLCSSVVRQNMGSKLDEENLEKLCLPKTVTKYLDLKDSDMIQHFKDKNMILKV